MMHFKQMLHAMLFLVGFISQNHALHAAFEYPGLGWPAASANIKVLGSPHPHRLLKNPALLGHSNPAGFSIQYQKPFQGLGLQAGSLASVYLIGEHPFISGLEYFGDEAYSEWQLTSGTVWSLDHGIEAGISLNFQHLRVTTYNPRSAATLSASMVLEMGGGVRIGSILEHIAQLEKTLPVPQKFHIGADYRSGPLNIVFALEKESALPMELCLGMIFSVGTIGQLGVGYRDLSQSLSAGWRLSLPRFGMNYTCVIHPELPLSHGFGLEFNLK